MREQQPITDATDVADVWPTLGAVLVDLRGERSQRAYGRALGVSHNTIRAWEAGEYKPSRSSLIAIANDARLSDRQRAALFVLSFVLN